MAKIFYAFSRTWIATAGLERGELQNTAFFTMATMVTSCLIHPLSAADPVFVAMVGQAGGVEVALPTPPAATPPLRGPVVTPTGSSISGRKEAATVTPALI